MNQAARDKLREAWLHGQKQAFGDLRIGEALCAMGVLSDMDERGRRYFDGEKWDLAGDDKDIPCPVCGAKWPDRGSLGLIARLNDLHRLDFAKIAELMP